MTLRVTFQIVPYGSEADKYEIYRLNISNQGVVEDRGFGHVICEYRAEMFRRNNETIQGLGMDEYELEHFVDGLTHNRRDGAAVLVRKVLEEIGEI